MSSATMRAAVIARPQHVRVQRDALPEPAAGEVRVHLEGCGVCGSNAPVWEGRPWFTYPFPPGSPGHEGWGTIDLVGADVPDLSPGHRVAMLSSRAFAEYDVAPAASVTVLPPALQAVPFPGEPLACAFNVFRRSAVRSGDTVAIVGIGFLGAVLVALSAQAGARVFAISRRRFACDVALAHGAAAAWATEENDAAIREVRDATGGVGCDCVIEATGLQEPLDMATQLTRERGQLVIAGYHQDGPRRVDMQLWNWRGLDVINAHERDPSAYVEGMRLAAEAVAAGRLDPSRLYTHRVPLEELDRAFRIMHERPDGFMKVLVTP